MQKQFLNFIYQKKLFSKKDLILLTLSGGIDSIVLFDLLLKLKIRLTVAHCNFGMRGAESDEDEKFVKQLCLSNKIVCYTQKFNTPAFAEKMGISTQMAARELRYEWFEKLRKECGLDWIATAHHQTDVVETMLINLMRGTGIAGLHGISAKNGKIIRPLLFANRNEIKSYAAQNKLTFREDSSNASDDYLRNKIRHHVLPELEKINPLYEQSFFDSANKIAQAETIFNLTIAAERKRIEELTEREIRFSISELKKLKPRSLYLYEFFKPFKFTASMCADIESCLDSDPGKLFYSTTHRLLIDRYYILISKLEKKSKKEHFFIPNSSTSLIQPFRLQLLQLKMSSGFSFSKQKNCAQVDAAKLHFPLEIRKWRKGDTFYPLGMKGSKKLSDFFIDNKLSIFEKEKVWLICSENKIVWVVNHRLDDRFKIGPETKRIVAFEYFEKQQ
ncbi:MAG: tRNA lysidine(34) synthetase TilS [Bacteroidetes bacterium]|nr:tRNA lysidine(34) synthetase TilS [Bacteroidota bacterium]